MKRSLFVICAIAALTLSNSANAKYSGGLGTSDDPYQIASVDDIFEMVTDVCDYNSNFVLTADINLAGNTFTTGVIAGDANPHDWFEGTAFTGVFDGAGHKIINLYINAGGIENDYLGLFGYVDTNGVIKNLRVENFEITGGDYSIGGLAGLNGGTISDCGTTGTITAGDNSSGGYGGLTGANGGTISNCYSICNITGKNYGGGLAGLNSGFINETYSAGTFIAAEQSNCHGGLVGYNGHGIISKCYSTSNLTNACGGGGLVGTNFGGRISDCYATGNVSGSGGLGGLVGENENGIIYGMVAGNNVVTTSDPCNIINCYSTGIVRGTEYVGGLAGINSNCNIISSYFLKGSGHANGNGTALTSRQMKKQASFIGWDFAGETDNGTEDVWMMFEGVDYPKLAWSFDGNCPIAITRCTFTIHRDNYNSILITGKLNATADDFMTAKDVNLFIDTDYGWYPYKETFPINYGGNFKNDKFRCELTRVYLCDCKHGKALFKYDAKTGKFLFKVNDYGLNGFSCPMTLRINIGDYNAVTILDESIVNGKRPIPIKLLLGVKNSLRADKTRFTHNRTTSQITRLTISGGISVDNIGIDDANLAVSGLNINLAGQTFTIPAEEFKFSRGKFTCSKVLLANGEIASATFDFNRCTFTLTIKGTKIDDAGTVDFNMEFGDFIEGAEVELP